MPDVLDAEWLTATQGKEIGVGGLPALAVVLLGVTAASGVPWADHARTWHPEPGDLTDNGQRIVESLQTLGTVRLVVALDT